MRSNKKKKTPANRGKQRPIIRVVRSPMQPSPLTTLLNTAGNVLTKGLMGLVTGFGDYKVYSNTLMTSGVDPPQVTNSTNGGFVVRHREYIGDVLGTINFTQTSYALNPGIPESFPWLSTVASEFEQYRWRGMIFEFKSTSSDSVLAAAANSALGTAMMATQYDPYNPPFPDKHALENYVYASSNKPSVSFIHPIECARGQTPITELYTRVGAPPASSDLRMYDLGTFTIATQGQQANGGVVGELWASYEVELFKPRLFAGTLGNEILTDALINNAPALVTNATPLGNGSLWTASVHSVLGCSVNSATRILSFPANLNEGYYFISFITTGTAAVVATPTLTFTNCAFVNVLPLTVGPPPTYSSLARNVGASSTTLMFNFTITITAANATVLFATDGTLPTAATLQYMFITQLNGSLP